jgi:outer membrane protein assembly factor BamB
MTKQMKRTLFTWIVCVVSLVGHAADGRNAFVLNFSKFQTARSGAQTWQIAPYNQNWIYFANQTGLLQYNGNSWQQFQLHNEQSIRSVLPSPREKRIYAGGISEFGYYTITANGVPAYTCMSDSVNETERYIGNVWGIHELAGALYFQGDNCFLKYADGTYTVIDAGCKIDCSALVEGILYAGTDEGVKIVAGNQLIPLNGAERLNTKRIRGFVSTAAGTVVVTASYGLFLCDGHRCVPYTTGVESFLERNEVFCATTSDGKLALGTVREGVVVLDAATGEVDYYSEADGLQDNTILSLAFDKSGNLWVGTDNGIDYICLNSPLSSLYPAQQSYGSGYAALPDGAGMYLGTGRGLYYFAPESKLERSSSSIRMLPHSSGQVWSLQRIGGRIFCFHDRGIFIIDGMNMKRITEVSGAWRGEAVMGNEHLLIVGVYDGIYLLKEENGQWQAQRIEGISDSFRFFCQETARILWMTDTEGCYRVELDNTLTRVVRRTQMNAAFRLPEGKLRLHKIDGTVYVSTEKGFYRYEPASGRMVKADALNEALDTRFFYYHLTRRGGSLFGLTDNGIVLATQDKQPPRMIPFDIPQIELVPEAESIVALSDTTLLLPVYNGFLTVSLTEPSTTHPHHAGIRNVFITHPKDSLLFTANFLAEKPQPVINYHNQSVRIEFGDFSFPTNGEVTYQYRLSDGAWSQPGTVTTKEYTLPEGKHRFEVRTLFADGTTAEDSFSFRILPPWYRSDIAYGIYALLLLVFCVALYKWDDLRVKRKKQQVVVEKDKEIAQVEYEKTLKEKQIIRLEKEKLERDLQYKSQEMANLMINFTQKNEMLSEIKNDLREVMNAVKAGNEKEIRQRLLVAGNKIDLNTNSEEVLHRIEEEFDLIHNNFMTRLQERHPELSFNERMMCAYLKMNLTSKEIAPLFNFSIRGAETMRYRIRKKLGLAREESLQEYLNKV